MQKPIGIFDSGVGGLTVAKEVSKLLPNEKLIYFGDIKNLPYGKRTPENVRQLSKEICRFLVQEKDCKAIVIACNTASAAAGEYLETEFPKIPIINVIEPMVEFIGKIAEEKMDPFRVGIIATQTTTDLQVYPKKLTKCNSVIKSFPLATPELAEMVEQSMAGQDLDVVKLRTMLEPFTDKNLDVLLLACTHYGLIHHQISSVLGPSVQLIDSASVTAQFLKRKLESAAMTAPEADDYWGNDEFWVSAASAGFQAIAQKIFGKNIVLRIR